MGAEPPTLARTSITISKAQPQSSKLDLGETEAIALAEELQADLLLIDDAEGRDEAARRRLQTIGTLGVLRDAHRAGLLDFRIDVVRLRAQGFYASQTFVQNLIDSL